MKMTCPSLLKYVIDVPPSKDLEYQASLGHKVNHSFMENSFYILYDSARYVNQANERN